VPQFQADFPAQVLIVTAFPELYFDEDIRDGDARIAFGQALANLQRWANPLTARPEKGWTGERSALSPWPTMREAPSLPDHSAAASTDRGGKEGRPLAVAVFSAAADFSPSPARRRFFAQVCAIAQEVWQFRVDENNRLELTATRGQFVRARAVAAMSSSP